MSLSALVTLLAVWSSVPRLAGIVSGGWWFGVANWRHFQVLTLRGLVLEVF